MPPDRGKASGLATVGRFRSSPRPLAAVPVAAVGRAAVGRDLSGDRCRHAVPSMPPEAATVGRASSEAATVCQLAATYPATVGRAVCRRWPCIIGSRHRLPVGRDLSGDRCRHAVPSMPQGFRLATVGRFRDRCHRWPCIDAAGSRQIQDKSFDFVRESSQINHFAFFRRAISGKASGPCRPPPAPCQLAGSRRRCRRASSEAATMCQSPPDHRKRQGFRRFPVSFPPLSRLLPPLRGYSHITG